VQFSTSDGPNAGNTGMSDCLGASNTGEALGPYATQVGSNPGYPAANPMLVKDHSESDIRVDPTNSNHLIGQSKWFVSAEGYNHLLGFYESFDGGASWPTQGHVPGYEGWTDNTDPVGAFDRYGNFYSLILPYQFFYNADGSHNFQKNTNREPNPAQPAELISVSVRPHADCAAPIALPEIGGTPQGSTYLFPHVTPDGAVYTTLVNETPAHGSFASTIWLDQSHDGGLTWTTGPAIVKDIPEPPFRFTN